MHVVLASQSPRRKELLEKIFPLFEIEHPYADEDYIGESPKETVMEIAKRKVMAIEGELVIGCDTVVYHNGIYYNKPKDRQDAILMISKLNNNTHSVFSGVSVKYKGKIYCDYEESKVKFAALTKEQIEFYVDEYKPYDKAGAYGIQDEFLVKSYSGDYYNIMGLPIECLRKILIKVGALSVKE